MMPWEDLKAHWLTIAELQVYDTLTAVVDVPCLAILPDNPWIEPNGFSIDQERYVAYAISGSNAPPAAQRQLHVLLHFIRHHLPDGWAFVAADGPTSLENQGVPYIGAVARLTFNACTGGDPYEGESST